ncbi:hypothetical protein DSO57_1007494 [Entomophthora muscae]|uniref:Uncharacterized protein n=1 Tax=Entomophthora muscae TaxID=34485 RepID=A0ACC2TJB1_9FUNG|nr:hypothetical protein DSO57_1007494 [Entomophthora muscae]
MYSLWLLSLSVQNTSNNPCCKISPRSPKSCKSINFWFFFCFQMLVSLVKFVAFTLATVLVIIWTTSPDLWSSIYYSFHQMVSGSTQFMHMFEDIPGRTQDILANSENIVRSLTCDNLELSFLKPVPLMSPSLASPMALPSEDKVAQV